MIHTQAIISEKATIGSNVKIAPFAVIDENVVIGDNCIIGPHVHITGRTTIGNGTKIHTGAVIGDEPQDISFTNDMISYTEIGHNCVIREYVTIHRGSKEGHITRIGNDCMLMAFAHIAHDCQLGNNVIIVNNCQIAGHVEIGDRATISANAVIHQFVRIGRQCMISANARIPQDVPPFVMMAKDAIYGPNAIGLKRGGMSLEDRTAVRNAIRTYFISGAKSQDALLTIQENWGKSPAVQELTNFIKTSKRGLMSGTKRQK